MLALAKRQMLALAKPKLQRQEQPQIVRLAPFSSSWLLLVPPHSCARSFFWPSFWLSPWVL